MLNDWVIFTGVRTSFSPNYSIPDIHEIVLAVEIASSSCSSDHQFTVFVET